jgi:hypothetical protein
MPRARGAPIAAIAMLTAGFVMVAGSAASAQQALGIDPGRDCQTVRTCDFSRTGRVRGCLSSYTCRVCWMVPARCTLAGYRRCQRVVCTWGGRPPPTSS